MEGSVSKRPEANIQAAILDYLAAERIWCRRFNTGATIVPGEGGFKRRFISYGSKGMADILCTPIKWNKTGGDINVVWIEVKAPAGRQSQHQKNFQEEVESSGHSYLLARSVDDVMNWMKENGAL